MLQEIIKLIEPFLLLLPHCFYPSESGNDIPDKYKNVNKYEIYLDDKFISDKKETKYNRI